MEDLVRSAIDHHVTTNRHHPEFHADPNDMTDVDVIEMVCDWTAMSQEFGQDGVEVLVDEANKTIGNRLHLNEERKQFVYAMIDLLDSQLNTGAGVKAEPKRWTCSSVRDAIDVELNRRGKSDLTRIYRCSSDVFPKSTAVCIKARRSVLHYS